MRTRVTSRLPALWPAAGGLVAQGGIRPSRRSRLRAKVLVFGDAAALRCYWQERFDVDPGRRCLGVVNALRTHVGTVSKDGGWRETLIEVDARYFCVIGLAREHLTCRILSHECVHAAFNYAKRTRRTPWATLALKHDEEAIAYPTGELMCELVRFLQREKLI